ncbi:MAG: hypothetical protein LBB20_02050 [Puniceicoccales bacterium]|nr:hypothetical protein [Puniceicoccales bacterium]
MNKLLIISMLCIIISGPTVSGFSFQNKCYRIETKSDMDKMYDIVDNPDMDNMTKAQILVYAYREYVNSNEYTNKKTSMYFPYFNFGEPRNYKTTYMSNLRPISQNNNYILTDNKIIDEIAEKISTHGLWKPASNKRNNNKERKDKQNKQVDQAPKTVDSQPEHEGFSSLGDDLWF